LFIFIPKTGRTLRPLILSDSLAIRSTSLARTFRLVLDRAPALVCYALVG
jgi:hypothetical protein